MKNEEKISQELIEKFGYLENAISTQRERRMSTVVSLEKFPEVFDYMVKKMGFNVLSAITGLDEGNDLVVIYHLSADCALMLNLKTRLARDNPTIKTVTSYFSSAEIYERELEDLLGIKVSGLGDGPHYPLPDNWPKGEFPLRKDYKGAMKEKKESKDA